LTDDDRTSINTELSTLRDEIDRIATSTTFNGKKLLDGSMGTKLEGTGLATANYANINVANANAGTTFTMAVDGDKLKITWTEDGVNKTAYGDVGLTNGSVAGKVNFSDAGIVVDFGEKAVASGNINSKTITTDDEMSRAEFKIGANTFKEDVLSAGIGNMSAAGLNREYDGTTKFSIDISTSDAANKTLDAIDYALDTVSAQRATIGTMQNRMEYAVSNLSTTEENLTAAESRIRDVDMAEEMVSYTKNSILNQSAMAMLSQANQQPQAILALLQ